MEELKNQNPQTPLQGDLESLKNIISSINSSLTHQVLANCDILDCDKNNIELLVKSPVRQIAGRLAGTRKIIERITEKVNQLER